MGGCSSVVGAAPGGCSVAVICGCRWVGDRLGGHRVLRPFTYVGQMALSLYIVHVFAFIFPLVVFTIENPGYWNLGKCVASTAAFCAVATAATVAWRHFLPYGPAEWLMRRFSDFPDRKRWLSLAGAGALMAGVRSATVGAAVAKGAVARKSYNDLFVPCILHTAGIGSQRSGHGRRWSAHGRSWGTHGRSWGAHGRNFLRPAGGRPVLDF